jgi:hypothetical protein
VQAAGFDRRQCDHQRRYEHQQGRRNQKRFPLAAEAVNLTGSVPVHRNQGVLSGIQPADCRQRQHQHQKAAGQQHHSPTHTTEWICAVRHFIHRWHPLLRNATLDPRYYRRCPVAHELQQRLLQHRDIELVRDRGSVLVAVDQIRFAQHREVPRQRRLGQWEMLGEFARRHVLLFEQFQDSTTRRIGQCSEHGTHVCYLAKLRINVSSLTVEGRENRKN